MQIQINPRITKDLFTNEKLYWLDGVWISEALYRYKLLRMGEATFTLDSDEPLIFALTQDGYHRFQNMMNLPSFDWDHQPESLNFLSF